VCKRVIEQSRRLAGGWRPPHLKYTGASLSLQRAPVARDYTVPGGWVIVSSRIYPGHSEYCIQVSSQGCIVHLISNLFSLITSGRRICDRFGSHPYCYVPGISGNPGELSMNGAIAIIIVVDINY